ncbi:DNA-binding transcriptional regulator, MarR family [Sphingobium sp. YR768]|nr:DNA-binding transcriptional regulator, MarR family [Sphingobium sp. YR768]
MILASSREARDRPRDRERLARIMLRSRERRKHSFPSVTFGEPGWDMILQLYVAYCAGEVIDVSGLCGCTGVSKTTALRHLDRLAAQQLVERLDDSADGRRIFVQPSKTLLEQTEQWLDAASLSLDIESS